MRCSIVARIVTIQRKTEEGLRRLVGDLENLPAPGHLKQAVLRRIETEPARVETDRHGGIVAINPAFTGLCGYHFSEIRGRKPGSFLQGAGTDPAVVATLRQAVKNGEPCTVEILNYHKDGSPYRVRISLEPIHTDGELTGFRAAETALPAA